MSFIRRLFASRKHPYIPGLDQREHVEVDLSGNKLRLLLPPHCPYENFQTDIEPPAQLNIYDTRLYTEMPLDEPFISTKFIKRSWYYYGPIWQGQHLGYTNFTASIEKANCLPAGMSCFNPSHLEQTIIHRLYYTGPGSPQFHTKRAPINWQIQRYGDALWVYFEVYKQEDKCEPTRTIATQYSSYAITALDRQYYLILIFNNHGYKPAQFATKKMDALRNEVNRHAEIQLSQTASENLSAAKRQWPDATISAHREPESWTYPEWRDGDTSKGEPRIVILKPGSSPPPFIFS